MTEVTLHSLEVVPESELAALSDEVFGDEQPTELLSEVLAAEAASRIAQEKAQGTFGLAAFRGSKLVGWTEGYRVGRNQFHMLSEVYGPLVQLKYLVGEPRRNLYKTRTAPIRPTPR